MSTSVKSFLPSKKFIIVGSTIIGIGLVVLGIYYFTNKKSNAELSDITVGDVIKQDSDGDGVPDWQEKLTELRENNPQIADLPETTDTASFTSGTYTEQFAQDIFVTLAALSQDGPIDAAATESIGQNLSSFVTDLNASKTWTRADITIVGNNSGAVQNYIARYNLFTQIYNPTLDPFTPLEKSMSTEDPSHLTELDPILQHQIEALEGLQSEQIPEKFANYHLDLMNSIQGIQDAIIGMQQYFTDPLLTFSAILSYRDNLALYMQATESIGNNLI